MEDFCEENRKQLYASIINERGLVHHQLETYNQFLYEDLKTIIDDEASIVFTGKRSQSQEKGDKVTERLMLRFENVSVTQPIVINEDRTTKPLFPSEARQKGLNYEGNILVDIVECAVSDGQEIAKYPKQPIAKIPIMVGSKACRLYSCTPEERILYGEGERDPGGYFIINGNERALVGQMRNAYNRSICYRSKPDEPLLCEMRSMSEETGHSILVKLRLNLRGKPDKNDTIDLLTQAKATIPIGFVFKVLKVVSLHQLKALVGDEPELERYLKLILSNSGDEQTEHIEIGADIEGAEASDSEDCSETAVNLKKIKQFIEQDIFPHLGISSSREEKAILLGKMVRKLLLVNAGKLCEEDRDNYSNKRVEMAGVLCFELFRMLYKRFVKTVIKTLDSKKKVEIDAISKLQFITSGLQSCFSSGNWGVQKNAYIRTGVVQIIQNKVSVGGFFSHLRRFVIPVGKEGKNTKIRQIHQSSVFFACPSETPEGQPVGVTLNLSMLAGVSLRTKSVHVKEIIESAHRQFTATKNIDNGGNTPIFVNGSLCGFTPNPPQLLLDVQLLKKTSSLRPDVSAVWDPVLKEIHISSDAGRFVRPLINLLAPETPCWSSFSQSLKRGQVLIKDAYEIEQTAIAIDLPSLIKHPNAFSLMEVHPEALLGVMAAQIPYSEHTQSPRNCYQASMAKQAIGFIPASHIRSDTTAYTMPCVERPLVSTQTAEICHLNDYPNGVNCIVAIAAYSGYNQEDSIILKKEAVERGLFNVIASKTYTVEERRTPAEEICLPPPALRKPGLNYSLIDDDPKSPFFGVVRKGTYVKKNDVLVGKVSASNRANSDNSLAISLNSEAGLVDRIIKTTKKGILMYKVTVSHIKIPEIGDKFCSATAQKGTCGMIMQAADMPFAKDGTIPDMIINPHCIPSRMTINQLMTTVQSLICVSRGERTGNGSPFQERWSMQSPRPNVVEALCSELGQCGLDPHGKWQLMNGITGEYMKMKIFMGPTYYHRLTHMVSNKIFSRPSTNQKRNSMTRQPLNGRANDGGLRLGEMEKDCCIAHGTSLFLQEKMFDTSDKFSIKLCRPCRSYLRVSKEDDGSFICLQCKGVDIVTMIIPFATKLVFQELNAMGIQTLIEAT